MNLLAITVYAGSEKLVKMTEQMLQKFATCTEGFKVRTAAFNNAAERPIAKGLVDWHAHSEEGNIGFGRAVNLLIEREVFTEPLEKFTHVLVLNNDLVFDDNTWLHHLLAAVEGNLVLSPCTDRTATKEALARGPVDIPPIRSRQVSAFCWLVPVPVIKAIKKRFGFYLFHPDFTNYGSDDATCAILRRHLDPRPFKIVPRSWVRHLKAQTGNEMGLKGGDPEIIARLNAFYRAKGLK